MPFKKALFYLLVALLPLCTAGCLCYSLNGGSWGSAKSFSVDFFQNKATQVNPTLSQAFTDKLKDKFLRESKLEMVRTDGDFAFSGSITSYTVTPANVTSNNTASLSRLSITVSVKFINKTDKKQNFEQSFTEFDDFNASQSFTTVEPSLVDDITTKLVQDIYNRAVINW